MGQRGAEKAFPYIDDGKATVMNHSPPPHAGRDKVREHRQRLRAQGLGRSRYGCLTYTHG